MREISSVKKYSDIKQSLRRELIVSHKYHYINAYFTQMSGTLDENLFVKIQFTFSIPISINVIIKILGNLIV